MPVNLGEARGSVVIDTSDVRAAEGRVKTSAQRMNKSLDGLGKGVGGLTDQFRQFDNFLGASFLAGAAVGLGRMALELGKASAQAELTEQSFDKLASGVGQSSDELLDAMRTASRGVVTDSNLILGANRAIVSGVADDAAELTQILTIARATGQAFGFTTSEAFDKIVRGVSKLEPELLDELGITVQLDQVFRSYAAALGVATDSLTELQRRQALLNEIIRQTKPAVDAAANSVDSNADKYERMTVATDNLGKSFGALLNAAGAPSFVELLSKDLDKYTAQLEGIVALYDQLVAGGRQVREAMLGAIGLGGIEGRGGGGGVSGTAPWGTRGAPPTGPAFKPRFDDEQRSVIRENADAILEIERDSQQDRLESNRNYNEQVASTERDYQQTLGREAQDFATSRLRQEADFADSILDIRRDAGRREVDQAEDLARTIARSEADSAERIADAREDTADRLAELDENFKRDQERRQEDFEDDMLSAAGRLDAIELLELRKGRAREIKDAADAHKEQRQDLEEQLQERIDDENESLAKGIANAREAHDRQIADAREADELRIQDMKADFEERKRLEDADRALRLARMAEDRQDQLDEMARQHALDLQQIATNEADKRAQQQEEFDKELHEAGIRNEAWIKEDNRRTNAAVSNYLRASEAGVAAAAAIAAAMGATPIGPSPLNPMITPGQWPSLLGGGGTATASTARTTTNSRTVNIAQITINGDGLNEQQVVDILIRELENN